MKFQPFIPLTLVLLGGNALFAPPANAQKTENSQKAVTEVKPLPVATVLKKATAQAKKEKKRVLVIYHASWCGWCKRLDKVMENPDFKSAIKANYVVVHLDVQERGEKKSLENPGGNELMKAMGGEKSGLPFYVFLDEKGKPLATSNVMPQNQNIGYPGAAEEIVAFTDLLKKTAPRLTPTQTAQIADILKANEPK